MKFRKITLKNHELLGNLSFDFTDKYGKTIDNIIIAGENGCGKSVFLKEIFQYKPNASTYYIDKFEKMTTEIELNDSEIKSLMSMPAIVRRNIKRIYGNIIKIEQDFSPNSTYRYIVKINIGESEEIKITENVFPTGGFNSFFKYVYSDVEINFSPRTIKSITSSNIDEYITEPIKSSNNIASEITQLLVDIDTLDNSDLAKWVKENEGCVPPEEVKNIRIKRFTNAFHSIFPNKRYVGIDNINDHKYIKFEEFGKQMSIDNLSSGEKQIVFRGGFLLRNQKTTEGAVVLIDEPEISLHPEWQLKIMTFLKNLFIKNGKQTSQLIVATHSPFIIHNATRANDKVIVMKKNNDGTITISQNPEYYSWTEAQIVKEAFNITPYLETGKINVFLEGETDEKYYNKAIDVFGIDKDKISFKWIGRNTEKGKAENTGDCALNNAVSFFKANPEMALAPIVMLYDCDTNKGSEDCNNLYIRTMSANSSNTIYKRGIENLLVLPSDFNKDEFYSTKEIENNYGGITIIKSLNKMKLCEYICSLDNESLKLILENINLEIQKILSIK